MIKLHTSLPNTITVQGREFLIKTDFRYWLLFDEVRRKPDVRLSDFYFLFKGEIPQGNFLDALYQFFKNPNSTPHDTGENNENVMDYLEDGEFIYSSFMMAYGIDLLDKNTLMHWHKFKALLIGLPRNTMMKEVIGLRSYTDDRRKPDAIAKEQKRMWSLPDKIDEEIMREINAVMK